MIIEKIRSVCNKNKNCFNIGSCFGAKLGALSLLVFQYTLLRVAFYFYVILIPFIIIISILEGKFKEIILIIFGFLLTSLSWFGLVSLIMHYPTFLPLWLFFIIGIFLLEIFFWFDKGKPNKKQSKFWFTCLKKGEALLEATAVLGLFNLLRLSINKLRLVENREIIFKWVGYIGAGLIGLAIVIGIIYLYIKLNSLKYQKK